MAGLTVIQLIPALEYGGVEKGTLEIAAGLVKRGHRSIVIAKQGPLTPDLLLMGSEYIPWSIGQKSLFTFRYVFKLAKLIHDVSPDIIHVRSRVPAWILWFALKLISSAKKPVVVSTVHGLYSVNRYSKIMTKADKIIAVSQTAKHYVLKNYPDCNPQKIVVIYRGIEPDFFPYQFKPSETWLQKWLALFPNLAGKKILCLPARISPNKGIETFIRFVDTLVQQQYPVVGIVVGSVHPGKEPYQKKLNQLVDALCLRENLYFTGARSDIREIMAVSDVVFSLSSHPESFGRTVLEALSIGKPVVGYEHGGVGEILDTVFPQGKVKPFSEADLVEKTKLFLSNPPPVLPQSFFLTSDMIDRTISLYEELHNASNS